MKFLQIASFYDNYLLTFYKQNANLAISPFDKQMASLFVDSFGGSHMIAPYLIKLGYDSQFIVLNCQPAQFQWAKENNYSFNHNYWAFEILKKQIETFRPDVIYNLDPINCDSNFFRSLNYNPSLILGWRAACIPPNIDWSLFDSILTNSSICRDQALKLGAKSAEFYSPGFPDFIADTVKDAQKEWDVVFSGSLSHEHTRRINYLNSVAKTSFTVGKEFSMAFFAAANPQTLPPDIAKYNFGPRWGLEMYKALRKGKIVLNVHIDLSHEENTAGNMRLFEATGVGSFLLTDHFDNIKSIFEPGKEIETFKDQNELIDKIHFYIDHPEEREAIAKKGQERCLRDYSMTKKAEEFDAIIKKHLKLKSSQNVSIGVHPEKDPYDIAYEWGWGQPQLRELVYLCYKTPDFADNACRFFMSAEFHEAVRILSELGKKPDKNVRVLDFGCGNGVASYALARIGYSVVGVDSSLGELTGINAAKKIQNLDGVNFELVHATGEKIDFPDNSFDVIWMRETLHHIRDLNGFMKEIHRILKPTGIICTFRDHVIWNESQRKHFFATHPFNHITKDEGCYYLHEYLNAFKNAGLIIERALSSTDSVLNTYPAPFIPGVAFDENRAKARLEGNDLFSFFVRKPVAVVELKEPKTIKEEPRNTLQNIQQIPLESLFQDVSFGNNVQIIGLKNLQIGEGSCVGDDTWLNICVRDEKLRMKIGRYVLIGRQAVISTGGYLEIADYCVLAPRVYVADSNHIYENISQPILQQGVTTGRSVIVEENCWLGINSIISGHLTVSRGSVVGANTVVTKDVPPFCVVVGNPNRIIKMYNPETTRWEKTDSEEDIKRTFDIRNKIGIPSREEYRKILQHHSVSNPIDPIVAGRGINL
jgi:acetyltransferase-like isoleucine patch superfamily enzyme/ubiquinone/menaquinone biosynthesis C-methylase UbiE